MKASELRIGNYYNQFGHETLVSWATMKDLESAPIDQLWCKPIPLTEEWLRRLSDEDHQFVGFGTRIIFQCKNAPSIKYEFSAGRVHVYFNDELINIKEFVHDWQNIHHSLTSEELSISK